MENEIEWHYLPLDDEQYAQALLDLAALDEGAAVEVRSAVRALT